MADGPRADDDHGQALALATELHASGDSPRALELLPDLVAARPDDIAVRVLLARCLATAGVPAVALAAADAAVACDPTSWEAHALVARAALATDPDRAASAADSAVRLAPHEPEAVRVQAAVDGARQAGVAAAAATEKPKRRSGLGSALGLRPTAPEPALDSVRTTPRLPAALDVTGLDAPLQPRLPAALDPARATSPIPAPDPTAQTGTTAAPTPTATPPESEPQARPTDADPAEPNVARTPTATPPEPEPHAGADPVSAVAAHPEPVRPRTARSWGAAENPGPLGPSEDPAESGTAVGSAPDVQARPPSALETHGVERASADPVPAVEARLPAALDPNRGDEGASPRQVAPVLPASLGGAGLAGATRRQGDVRTTDGERPGPLRGAIRAIGLAAWLLIGFRYGVQVIGGPIGYVLFLAVVVGVGVAARRVTT